MSGPSRPPLRWFGGKWPLAAWIIAQLPREHGLYCEPFAGAASVLMQKPRAPIEVIGDLDHDLANLFFVLRDPVLSEVLRELCELTPYSWHEFWLACEPVRDPDDIMERARRMVVRHAMGVAMDASVTSATSTGFRDNSSAGRAPVCDWANWPSHVGSWRDRLRGVIVDCTPALATMRRHDRPDALFYVDPPYLPQTRRAKRRGYAHEMSLDDHVGLLEGLKALKGMVALSGYPSALYDRLLPGWTCLTRKVRDQASRARTEALWLSPSLIAQRERENRQPDLFAA
jgi:DNA adenine methylase